MYWIENTFVIFAIVFFSVLLLRWIVLSLLEKWKNQKEKRNHIYHIIKSMVNWISAYGILIYTLVYFRSSDWMFDPLFTISSEEVSVFLLILAVLIVSLTNRISLLVRSYIFPTVYKRYELDQGVRFTFDKTFHYVIMVLAILVSLSTVGFELSALTVFAGVIGVGIGFGMQNIASNFISGVILLFERPIKVGDRVVVDDIVGDVDRINMRATVIKTLDNEHIIVPNSYFLEEHVVNRSYSDKVIRLVIPVGVAYGSDVPLVKELLLQVAKDEAGVSPTVRHHPEPFVNFKEFGDSSLNFELFIWISNPENMIRIRSNVNFRIDAIFRENDVEIPFPQRDLHVRSLDTSILEELKK
ncbi:mechanosensitive ion channel [Halobacillus yeomjeoni]|uniref:Mechanosensitive ion channel n=1 Tax=Halobacillus yeomjeoni TaxID=311194 RepID=A0A931HWN1_9BACI|nr:mechanosensitive ion channel domain-containing protein [Halobacillus yeomjeoni]MBH0231172.1 mechanosensitive ion channel [Halobacillus yeomjeoni]MCA0984087.1 mechanosensitive ion channel [Halobacillus yeomjeoni]